MIELTKKTLKIDDKQEAHKQQSMEALTCSCEHPGISNFPTIHTQRPWKHTHWVEWNSKNVRLQHETPTLWIMILQQGELDMEV
jgi:hypothetical protein